MKKTRTVKDLKNDPRIEDVYKMYQGTWTVLSKKEYWFEENHRTVIGSVKECCEDVNELLTPCPKEHQID